MASVVTVSPDHLAAVTGGFSKNRFDGPVFGALAVAAVAAIALDTWCMRGNRSRAHPNVCAGMPPPASP